MITGCQLNGMEISFMISQAKMLLDMQWAATWERDLGDGEKNAGFVDWDGRWTKDGEGPAYIFPREATTVNTGCYDQENISGMMEPLGKVCPIDLEMGFFGASVRVKHQTSGQSFQHRTPLKSKIKYFLKMVIECI